MQKIIKETDKERGIVQITVADERWYLRPDTDKKSGIPTYKGVPSVTWICGFYPKGIGFYKWLAEKGWDEAEAIKSAAGDKGSRVHLAIEKILNGEEFRIDTKVLDKNTGQETELNLDELKAVKSFCDWYAETKPEILANEVTIFSDQHGYAGTIDLVCKIDGQMYVIDFKTSKQIWREHELQVSAYRVALESGENPLYEKNENGTQGKLISPTDMKTAILQIGYDRNRAGFKFTETPDQFDLFLTAKKIWAAETKGQDIKVLDFPIVLAEKVVAKQSEVTKKVTKTNK